MLGVAVEVCLHRRGRFGDRPLVETAAGVLAAIETLELVAVDDVGHPDKVTGWWELGVVVLW